MKRKIVTIDETKCNGCGLCVDACHEGALQLIDGKARLITDSYCDGLGACLPECPKDAIHIEEREAAAFDEAAVQARMSVKKPVTNLAPPPLACGCPGTQARSIERHPATAVIAPSDQASTTKLPSQLQQWPCQIKLVPVNAPYLENARLLIAADCTAYAYANLHQDFMRNKITLIGCPKLDEGDYAEKLTAIFKAHDIQSVTVLRMEVPCCGGIVTAVKQALQTSGRMIPWQVVTISTAGEIIEEL